MTQAHQTIQGKNTPQETFGEMLRVCLERKQPEAFHGDLYRDALWLSHHFDEAVAAGGFWWSLRQHGTALSVRCLLDVESGGTDEQIFFVEL